jgi:hypothetical protein
MVVLCAGCGHVGPDDGLPQRTMCPQCPPRTCECGHADSIANPCGCWVDVEAFPLADLKAALARDGLSVDTARG